VKGFASSRAWSILIPFQSNHKQEQLDDDDNLGSSFFVDEFAAAEE
jgi:hypothetical protein